MLLNNKWITEKNQRGNKKIPRDKWKQKHDNPKLTGCSKSSSKREVYGNTILPWKQEISQKNYLTWHLKQLEKEQQTKPKVSRRKKTIKSRAEVK